MHPCYSSAKNKLQIFMHHFKRYSKSGIEPSQSFAGSSSSNDSDTSPKQIGTTKMIKHDAFNRAFPCSGVEPMNLAMQSPC
jgi:hypothetical protein